MKRGALLVASIFLVSTVPSPLCGADEPSAAQGKNATEGTLEDSLPLVEGLFPWREGSRFAKPEGKVPEILSIAESPDGRFVAWGDEEGNLFVWDLQANHLSIVKNRTLDRPPAIFEEPIFRIQDLRFKNAKTLYWLESSGEGWVCLADLEDGRFVPRTRMKLRSGMPAVILPGSVVVSEPYAGLFNFWMELLRPHVYVLRKYDLETGKRLGKCEIYPRKRMRYHWVNAFAASPDDSLLAIASENNCGIVSTEPFRLVRSFGLEFVQSLAFSPDGSRLALANRNENELFVLKTESGELVRKITMPRGGNLIQPLAFSSNDDLWFHYWSHLYRLDILTGRVEQVLEVPLITAMMVSKDRLRLYVALWNGTFNIYRLPPEAAAEGERSGSGAKLPDTPNN